MDKGKADAIEQSAPKVKTKWTIGKYHEIPSDRKNYFLWYMVH